MAQNLVTVATCNLNQWAMDFDGNLARVKESIRVAKAKRAVYRLGPELEICGYGCEDHFLETDTFIHCNQSLAEILASDLTDGILCDIGMPVMHNNARYNCRIFCLNRKIILIRPKLFMADDGNYRETRFFAPWKRRGYEQHTLDRSLAEITGQTLVPFGFAAIAARNTTFGGETCEELWTPNAPHIQMCLSGVEIIGNGSGSHHQLRKLDTRVQYIGAATRKCGGLYLYSNQRGCDGSRLYFDGGSLIACNGDLLAMAPQFSLDEVEVVTATVDLDEIRSYRGAVSSFGQQAAGTELVPFIHVDVWLGHQDLSDMSVQPSAQMEPSYPSAMEECAFGPACWLWDYLRRSGAAGYFLALSGGADSSSVAAIVGTMCQLVADKVRSGDEAVLAEIKRVTKDAAVDHGDPRALASCILHCAYMGTTNSSKETEDRAHRLAQQIGAYHASMRIDEVVSAVVSVFARFISGGRTPSYESQGGTPAEDLALQNIQARVRMVLAYLSAQLLPWVRGRKGFLLVLGSANVDEGLRGYMTKYDCSSADLNPIGSISKLDLKQLLKWTAEKYGYSALKEIESAPPTAELRPLEDGHLAQTDEQDMGMSYEELGVFGKLRKISRCGPYTMFRKLVHIWKHLSPTVVADKVLFFFKQYSINRHKMTTLTPSYHAENYSPDDNRFDLRQFLYNTSWSRQTRTIRAAVARMEEKGVEGAGAEDHQQQQKATKTAGVQLAK
uniref:Glutamine-dependent NAD(+) synthetase n=1 Tax=Rhizochromulina marina TaxID=1034831 RepID=A0A7S2W193_9STRA